MVRNGWFHVEVPNGWVQLIRGPRPKAAQWPRASKSMVGKPQQQQSGGQPSKGAKDPQPERVPLRLRPSKNSDTTVTHLQEALKKAQAQARVPPMESRLKVAEEYLTRKIESQRKQLRKQLARRDRLRSEVEEEKSLARLKEEQQRFPQVFAPSAMDITAPATSTLVAEVEQLQTMVAQLWAQNEELMSSSKRQTVNPGVKDSSGRLREDFVPMCDEEAAQWIRDRQADMQDATSVGNAHELARLCHGGRQCSGPVVQEFSICGCKCVK